MYDLLHKHRVERTEDLITLKEALGEKLKGIQSFATQIEELEKQINVLEKEMDVLAGKIHKARVESETEIERRNAGITGWYGYQACRV